MNNKIILTLLFCFSLIACQNTEKEKEIEKKPLKDSLTDEKQIEEKTEEIKLIEGPNASIKVVNDIKGEEYSGYQGIVLDLGMGYKIKADSAWFGGNTYLIHKADFVKDGSVVYRFPHLDEDMRSISISRRDEYGNIPKVFTKSDQTVILIERYLGETEGGIQTDAIVLKGNDFKKYIKNLEFTGQYQYEPSNEEAQKIFNSIIKM